MLFTVNLRASSVCNASCRRRIPRSKWKPSLVVLVAAALCAPPVPCSTTALAFDPIPVPPPNSPPSIVDFGGTLGLLGWTFEGQVIDENPIGMAVTFGGLLDGHQVTVNDADGYFYYTVEINESGTVTAYTVDDEQQGSNVARYTIF